MKKQISYAVDACSCGAVQEAQYDCAVGHSDLQATAHACITARDNTVISEIVSKMKVFYSM